MRLFPLSLIARRQCCWMSWRGGWRVPDDDDFAWRVGKDVIGGVAEVDGSARSARQGGLLPGSSMDGVRVGDTEDDQVYLFRGGQVDHGVRRCAPVAGLLRLRLGPVSRRPPLPPDRLLPGPTVGAGLNQRGRRGRLRRHRWGECGTCVGRRVRDAGRHRDRAVTRVIGRRGPERKCLPYEQRIGWRGQNGEDSAERLCSLAEVGTPRKLPFRPGAGLRQLPPRGDLCNTHDSPLSLSPPPPLAGGEVTE